MRVMSHINAAAQARQDAARADNGQFGEQQRTAEETTLPRVTPELSDYWVDICDHFGVHDEDERAVLAEHLATPGVQESFTVSTTSRQVIADALEPGMTDAARKSDLHDIALRSKLDVDHRYLIDREGRQTAYYMERGYQSWQHGHDTTRFVVDGNEYATANDIPGKHRRARRLARAWETHRDDLATATDLKYDMDSRWERWSLYRHPGA